MGAEEEFKCAKMAIEPPTSCYALSNSSKQIVVVVWNLNLPIKTRGIEDK
jgi:hypothetical protein